MHLHFTVYTYTLQMFLCACKNLKQDKKWDHVYNISVTSGFNIKLFNYRQKVFFFFWTPNSNNKLLRESRWEKRALLCWFVLCTLLQPPSSFLVKTMGWIQCMSFRFTHCQFTSWKGKLIMRQALFPILKLWSCKGSYSR